MNDPKRQQYERDELDLDIEAETVTDLEPTAEHADQVRGGPSWFDSGSPALALNQ